MENYGVDFGYRFSQSAWGQGIAKEAANSVIRYGADQLKLKTIVAIVLPDNIASEKILISSGFTFVGMDEERGKTIKRYEIKN
jgi:ribosomal-protein-alanine N-acetyltransferase